ncbi:MAG: triose-phosphate isomerase [Acidimicrobiales bacterium]
MAEPKRKPLLSGNWKMHHNHLEAIAVLQRLSYALRDEDYEAVDVSVHPPFTDLRSLQVVIDADRLRIALGAQNCHWEAKGAFTGEVSPTMLAKMDVRYVIVGHSERRELFGETDRDVNQKATAVFAAGMTPIMCVGETLAEREAGHAEAKVQGQVPSGLAGLSPQQVGSMVIAYEPIWAIGTGRTATAGDAQAMCATIRASVAEAAGAEAAASVRIQYGGSVKPANTAELMAQPDIDGALVGGASLDSEEFSRIVRYRDA